MVDEHAVSGRSIGLGAVGAAGVSGAAMPAAAQPPASDAVGASGSACTGAAPASASAPGLVALFSPGGFARAAITDRLNCARPLPDQVARLAGKIDALILREKDLAPDAYERLARDVRAACERAGVAFIAHTFAEPAWRAGARALHLPLPILERTGRPAGFELVGTNVHELDEIARAEALGADYLIASPVFAPSCKPLPGRGLDFLNAVIAQAHVPVLALGGITDATERQVRQTKAAGACRMSDYMRL